MGTKVSTSRASMRVSMVARGISKSSTQEHNYCFIQVGAQATGGLYMVSAVEGERFYFRPLLLHVKGLELLRKFVEKMLFSIAVSEDRAKRRMSLQMTRNGCEFLQIHLGPFLRHSYLCLHNRGPLRGE